MLKMASCQRLNLRGLVFHEHSTTGSHFPSFFSFFYLKVYLNMSRLSTVCVKRHPTGDKNGVCESLSTSGRVWHHKNSIIYAPPNALYGRLTLNMESHRIVYPWDVFLRYKRR